jgi:DNA-binding IclR family transcriptional regulator
VSKTLLNRLAMFETLDACGPLTIVELARRSGLDATVVSRTVAACEPDGWLIRVDGRIALGPRCTLLGHSGPTADVIDRAAHLVHAVAGVTGLVTHAYGLVGTHAVLIAAAAGRSPGAPVGLGVKAPLYATAGGRAIAVQLRPERLDALLPAEPFPDADALIAAMSGTVADVFFSPADADLLPRAQPGLARTRGELAVQLDAIRAERFAFDAGAFDPALHCIATPWPQPALPASLVCLGPAALITAGEQSIKRVLTAAAQPGAGPQDVIAASAA